MLRYHSANMPNRPLLDWNDLRYFLAVARGGSTLAAGRALRVSQTTVARRIAALEEAVSLTLFERRQAGYALTPEGVELLAHAEAVEAAAQGFDSAASASTRDLTGNVRVTTEEIFAVTLLAPMLRELHELHPEIMIELDTAQAIRDLGAGEADIALRSTIQAAGNGLVGRRLCRDDWTLYCSRDYATRNGVPTSLEDLRNHAIIGGGGGNLWRHYQAWLQSLGLEEQVAMHHASSTGLLSGVRSGFGIAVLPCIVADAEPDLIRCLAPREAHERTFWLLTHERVRNAPRVRTVIDFLYERLRRHVASLTERLDEADQGRRQQRQA
jgi:DNA-binding transcriptional LysR family regulator